MSQRETIYRMLLSAGDSGVTSRQFVDANIFRYSARIEELRKQGFEIATERVKGTLFRFILSGDNSSSLDARGIARGNALQEPERAGGAINTPSAPSLLSGNGSEVEMNNHDTQGERSNVACASAAVTSSQAEADGREYETNQVDVHRGPVERAVSRSETPVSLSLFDMEPDRSDLYRDAA